MLDDFVQTHAMAADLLKNAKTMMKEELAEKYVLE